jgi:hypothetical protein
MIYFFIGLVFVAIMLTDNNKNNITNRIIIKNFFFDNEHNKIQAFLNDDSYYYGEYKLNENGEYTLDGLGRILYKDNSSFVGYFKNNFIHGLGTHYYNDKSIFKKRFHNFSYGNIVNNDNFTLSYKEGRYFIGKYDYNSSINTGTMFYINGTSKYGNFVFINFSNGYVTEILN